MSGFEAAIADFSTLLNLDPQALAGRDHVAVDIDGVGECHIEALAEEVLLYLSRPIPVGTDRLALYSAALRSVHFENGLPAQVQCGLSGDQLIFLGREPYEDVSVEALEKLLDTLVGLHEATSG